VHVLLKNLLLHTIFIRYHRVATVKSASNSLTFQDTSIYIEVAVPTACYVIKTSRNTKAVDEMMSLTVLFVLCSLSGTPSTILKVSISVYLVSIALQHYSTQARTHFPWQILQLFQVFQVGSHPEYHWKHRHVHLTTTFHINPCSPVAPLNLVAKPSPTNDRLHTVWRQCG